MSVLKRDPIWGLCFLFKNSGLTHRWHQKPEQKIFPYRQFKQVERLSRDNSQSQKKVLPLLRAPVGNRGRV